MIAAPGRHSAGGDAGSPTKADGLRADAVSAGVPLSSPRTMKEGSPAGALPVGTSSSCLRDSETPAEDTAGGPEGADMVEAAAEAVAGEAEAAAPEEAIGVLEAIPKAMVVAGVVPGEEAPMTAGAAPVGMRSDLRVTA